MKTTLSTTDSPFPSTLRIIFASKAWADFAGAALAGCAGWVSQTIKFIKKLSLIPVPLDIFQKETLSCLDKHHQWLTDQKLELSRTRCRLFITDGTLWLLNHRKFGMKKALKNVTILMLWATFSWGIGAQTEDIAAGFKRPNVQEEQALRAILAEPIPQNALFDSLRLHLRAKEAAANKLGDEAQVEAVLRAAVRLLPDPVYKNNLARRLLNKGQL
jgi:hypothetical protein